MTNTWLKDVAYNFFTLFVGYNIEKVSAFMIFVSLRQIREL